ncbi:MAG: hypothetical protein JWM11_5601 [Planctomycetaceae bacterium]|nr:hypothetical protein [Planctomycetaceae bacterium]
MWDGKMTYFPAAPIHAIFAKPDFCTPFALIFWQNSKYRIEDSDRLAINMVPVRPHGAPYQHSKSGLPELLFRIINQMPRMSFVHRTCDLH